MTLLTKIISQVLNPLLGLVFVVATLVFVWGVVEFIGGAANPEKRITGRRHMMWGVFGLAIMFSVWGIVAVIQSYFGGGPFSF